MKTQAQNHTQPFCLGLGLLLAPLVAVAAQADEPSLYDRQNLVAWCIVPFDAAKRGPEERAAMLERLGIRQLAYDWRAEHVPSFDEEVLAMQRHGVRITAWWVAPPDLSETNRRILDVARRHGLKLQFWVLTGDPDAALPQDEKVRRTAAALRPFAMAAQEIDCQVGLYNHGGWFGEPENQLAVLAQLQLPGVGLVYNLHHGHAHMPRFEDLLARMRPHLLALNINGMTADGDQKGRKILPVGAGELDLELLRIIERSGYRGPIGILNHTDLDAEARLADNLAGLEWLVRRLHGDASAPRPALRSYSWEDQRDVATPVPSPEASNNAQVESERKAVASLLDAANKQGSALRGAAVFASPRFACLSCHRIGDQGGTVGPDLTKAGTCLTPNEIAEAILFPKRKVKPEFFAWALATDRGTVHQGVILSEDQQTLKLKDATSQQIVTLAKSEIVERSPVGSLMPDGLAATMTARQRQDVVRFLVDMGHAHGAEAARTVAHIHKPATFPFDAAPLQPDQWRFASQPVNRDRVYDFYAKQADYFLNVGPAARILMEYPGLDGGKYGHWGNQNENTWRDDRWKKTDHGSVLGGVFRAGELTVPRGVCVRLDAPGLTAVCFDPDTLRYRAGWSGEFLNFSPVRHGFLDGLKPAGEPRELDASLQAAPTKPAVYRGYYRHGRQVVFAYEVDGQPYLDSVEVHGERVVRTTAPADVHPLRRLTAGGPAQWPQVLETQGERGHGRPYAIDTIAPPRDNPWNALMYFGGHDFLPDGSAMVCTMQGDVWHVSGLDDSLARVRWKRFASGLHHPQGVVVADGLVYVLGRDQITRLHDLNADDEADFYECFCRAYETSPAGHDFVCGLERDASGNFYTASGNQGLLRISPDGKQATAIATGFRNPDGLGLLPDGGVTVPASEGEWTATSMVHLVRPTQPGHADAPPHFGYKGPHKGQPPQWPLVYLPRGLDNSAAGQVCISSDRWGPMRGQMVHLSYGAGTHFLLLRDRVGEMDQGAVVPLAGDFSSGPHRGRFAPHDGQLYVTGMAGWGTYTHQDGCFERVRYTGTAVQVPVGFHVYENGVRVDFTEPLESSLAGDASRQFAQAWNYRYGAAYGSPEFAPSHLGAVGHDRWDVASSHVLSGGRSLFLELPDLQPVNQLHLRMRVDSGLPQELYLTVHALDEPFTDFPGYEAQEKLIAAHPQQADLALLARPPAPNRWREPLPSARQVDLVAGQNLSFSSMVLTAKAGETLHLKFKNPDVVPHNWVLLRPGALERVGQLINRLIADPEAAWRQYVPQTEDVLVYTDIVPAGGEASVYFQAPNEPGRYPFLCSFPGHWMVMNGTLVVSPR